MMGLTTQGHGRPCATCRGEGEPRRARAAGFAAARRDASLGRPSAALAWLLALAGLMGGCGANMRAAVGTAWSTLDGGAARVQAVTAVDPRLEYLRVQIGRQVGLMVRGDPAAVPRERTTFWYSADGALLRLVDGRIVGLADGGRSWRVTQDLEAIDWSAVAANGPVEFARKVDRQPGYRIGEPQRRRLRAVAAGPAGHELQAPASRLQWFVEEDAGETASPPAWYAVDLAAVPPRVVYGQTCLAADWCINWQPWPPAGRSS